MTFSLDNCIERLYKGQILTEEEVKLICTKLKEVLAKDSNVVNISSPVTLVGDVHGQFYDVMELFRIGGHVPDTNYLFLGDYVDRGRHSVQTICLLAALKLRYPNRIAMIRGNHESRLVSQNYGFYAEVMRKYGNANVWSYIMDMFDYLTISALIDGRFFCVHGGLSPSIHTLDQVRLINRFQEIPMGGGISDMVWSDPEPSKDGFHVSPRGAGFTFGADIVAKFMHINRLEHIARAHQLCNEGYQVLFDGVFSTVWSAPNYCYRCGNAASILELDTNLERHYNIFYEAPENEREQVEQTERENTPEYFL